jgi:hypothetical protein
MAGLGISRGGIVAQPAGGGGAPPGDATIWPAVADWADLSTVAGPLRDGDQVFVQSLGTGNSYGVARYDEGDAEWVLLLGWFNSFANMEAFAEPIVTGALAAVEASASDDETAVRYQYESGWARTANNQPYVWALSDLVTLDPSGIGVTRVGDVGVFGACAYRLTAPLALPGGGTRAFWVPAEIYGRTPVVAGYADGSESNATVATQGLTVFETTGGTVSSLGTEHRFLAGGTAGGAAGFTFTAASANFYVRADVRAAFGSSGTWNGQLFIAHGIRSFAIAQTQLTSTAVRSIDSTGNPIARLIRTEAFPGVASAHRTYENLSPNEAGYSAGDLLASGGTAVTANLARVIVANGATPSSPATDFRTKNVLFMSYT